MAEIRVEERKDKKPIWPWILGALLLIGLIWGITQMGDKDRNVVADDRTEQTTTDNTTTAPLQEDRVSDDAAAYGANTAVQEYIMFAEQRSDNNGTLSTDNANNSNANNAANTDYVREGLQKLSAALHSLASGQGTQATGTQATGANNDADIQRRVETFQQSANQLQQNAQASSLRTAFMEAAAIMESIKQSSYPNNDADIDDVKSAAEEIEANETVANQRGDIDKFFEASSEALKDMTNATASQERL